MFRFFHRHSLTIVLYHGVAPEAEGGLAAMPAQAGHAGIYNYRGKFIRPDVFERQVAYMNRHYTILPVDEALRRLDDGTLPDYALAITFDDGYRNFYEHAYPVLKASHTPATMYL
ncbi:MAG: polysaccharide deacetylase family protein, partial [Candidatus Pacebacteria bacterium]|nr:polysaccharide deacetylase family protein [Candidatus Paceibacterota bacterium]